jgi:hypothetical protein
VSSDPIEDAEKLVDRGEDFDKSLGRRSRNASTDYVVSNLHAVFDRSSDPLRNHDRLVRNDFEDAATD